VADGVVVGSGPNGLAAAITLAAAGVDVVVYEAAGTPGGGTRSSELTLPGLIHDECSAAHPLALDNPFTREFDLSQHGLRWRWPEVQYSHPLDDATAGRAGVAAYRSVDATAAVLGADGKRWRALFGALECHFDAFAVDFAQPVLHVPRHPMVLAGFGAVTTPPASALARLLGPAAGALFGGTAAHAFRPLSAPMSAAPGIVLATAAHRYGWPVAAGGSRAIPDAMVSLLESLGGRVETGTPVKSLSELPSTTEIVMLDLSPRGALAVCGDALPDRVARAYRRFRYGPAAFKVDWAIGAGVPWTHEPSRHAGTVHVGGSFAEIAAAERDCARGRMPERPFVLVAQQYLADPDRSNGDIHPLYAYAHVPAGFTGDATSAIEAQIERFAPGFKERILARHVRDVAGIEADNANYVGGDIATGATDAVQLLMRPRVAIDPYATGIPGVYLCSAATPPGPGAHGICGWRAARSALRRL
jgi:phytoene dehydrogenase-like protein